MRDEIPENQRCDPFAVRRELERALRLSAHRDGCSMFGPPRQPLRFSANLRYTSGS
jgi:hypothetical protein